MAQVLTMSTTITMAAVDIAVEASVIGSLLGVCG
jgi:hypothetical protein